MKGRCVKHITLDLSPEEADELRSLCSWNETIPEVLGQAGEDESKIRKLLNTLSEALGEAD